MSNYSLYLFDFDGCLVDTFESLSYVFLSSLRDWNLNGKKEDVRQYSRQPLPKTYVDLGGDMSTYDEFYKNLCNKYLNSDYNVKLSKGFDDAFPTIKKLKEQGKKLGIVTSNNVPHVKEVLKLLDIDEKYFDVYVGNQESARCKPNPDPILKALELCEFTGDKSEVVYIGDALDDVIAGKAAGVDYILLDRFDEYTNYKEKMIKSLTELVDE